MTRCLELAKKGLGTTYPNPLVGSVIVYNNKIIGAGWHYKAGQPHAEVHAINSVTDTTLLKKATLYVSLEPCSHFGKTPPCANLIIQKGIKKVIIGSKDPNPKVSGSGIKMLTDAGCEVVFGVLENECIAVNKRFFTYHQKKRPYIILKWAKTIDGFIAPKSKPKKTPVWITHAFSRQLVHKWRSEEQAILVGTNTALEDNPSLTVRDWNGNNPLRCVIDKDLKIPQNHAIFNNQSKTLVFTQKDKEDTPFISYKKIYFDKPTSIVTQICDILYKLSVQAIIIEGGSYTLQTFINENLWDEARIFTGIKTFKQGVVAPSISGNIIAHETLNDDQLVILKND
jgi:diaminohydroxyphosphoribosylaminopyrimidine deaminase/5-amino-6-(5-phosphoribosylamino)uracil reductase